MQSNLITPQVLLKCCSEPETIFVPSETSLTLSDSLPLSLVHCLLALIGYCDISAVYDMLQDTLTDSYPVLDVLLPWLPQDGDFKEVDEEVWQLGVVTCTMIMVLSQSCIENEVSS